MTISTLNDLWYPFTGTTPNDGTGDTLKLAFDHENENIAFLANFLITRFPPGSSDLVVSGNITADGTITGDIISSYVYTTQLLVDGNAGVVQNLVVGGDLTVNGTTTSINTVNLDVTDKNITIAKGATSAAMANGAGLTVDGPANATLLYASADDSWNFNKKLTALSFYGSGIGLTNIPNSALTNSSVMIGLTPVSLGGSTSTLTGLTSVTATNFYGTSSSAKYADLAERYKSDKDYSVGTVLVFGGDKEVTTTSEFADVSVAGVVSDSPAYLMNMDESHSTIVALRGKVPVKVVGPVRKGDLLVTSAVTGFAESVGKAATFGQAVFAKSLVENLSIDSKIINAVIL